MNWNENIKHLLKLAFTCGVGWLIVQGVLHNHEQGSVIFFSFMIGFGFYAAYYVGKESK